MGIGERLPMRDGRGKVTGQIKFISDIHLPDMVYARLVPSPYAHGQIRRIDTGRAQAVPGVIAVLTAEDLPAFQTEPTSHVQAMLAWQRVIFYGQPVAVVLAETETAAEDGAALVEIDIAPQPAVIDPLAALQPDAPLVWPAGRPGVRADAGAHDAVVSVVAAAAPARPSNISDRGGYTRGDVAQGFAAADLTLELTYTTAGVHQSYLEPHFTVAAYDPLERIMTIWTGTQGPFSVRKGVADFLAWPENRVRVEPIAFGGGFGAKFLLLDPLAAELALYTGRPVQVGLSRSQEFLMGTPAPASIITLKTGVKRDGTLTALQARVIFDAGAFPGSPARSAGNALGMLYRIPHLEIETLEVLTHKPGNGAYRAPGAPQATLALESHMDEMARRLGMDGIAFRLQNVMEEGDELPSGKKYPRIGLRTCLETLRDHMAHLGPAAPGEGTGIAVGGWGGGVEPAASVCQLDRDGTVRIFVGAVDLQGTHQSMAQIAATTFGVSEEQVRITLGNTDFAPHAGGAGGSKITYTVGLAVQRAVAEARRQVLEIAANHLEAAVGDLEIRDGKVYVRGVPEAKMTLAEVSGLAQQFGGGYEPVFARGASAQTEQAPGFAAQMVRVQVDRETGRVQVKELFMAQDVGFAINPLMVEGQMHGGAAQGLGYGLWEAIVYDENGSLLTGSFMDYTMPAFNEMPPMETVIVEVPSPQGPMGARGVGEPPIIPGPAAVANAVRDAIGVRITDLPITSTRVWQALQAEQA